MKSYIWMGIVAIVLIAGMVFVVKNNDTKPVFDVNVVNKLDNVIGKVDSKTVIVEYSDFQCPACRNYYLVMRQMEVEFEDKVAFVYRHFPLSQHANAELAARVAEAAGEQDKFWPMHDLLFEKQSEWSEVKNPELFFESYAKLIGLNIEQFKTDLNSQKVKDFVKTQKEDAVKLSLSGTPSFFVNGKQIQNPASVEAFRAIIQSALQK